jgi:chaperone required for assembly of F1-ATPase
MIAEYGGSDLLCYRATSPAELTSRQEAAWDPVLSWAGDVLGAPLNVVRGVMPVAQPDASLVSLRQRVHAFDSFSLAAFHDLVSISGSLVLAFAVTERKLSGRDAWELSSIDENWQIEHWGDDEDANATSVRRRAAFLDAERVFGLIHLR